MATIRRNNITMVRLGETISRWFGHVLRAIFALKEEYIRSNYDEV